MPLVQINAIREILEDAQKRLLALVPPDLPGPTPPSLTRARADLATAIGNVARLEEERAALRADNAGVPKP